MDVLGVIDTRVFFSNVYLGLFLEVWRLMCFPRMIKKIYVYRFLLSSCAENLLQYLFFSISGQSVLESLDEI